MESTLFAGLIREATREITGRHPEYFSYYEVEVPPFETLAETYGTHPLLARFSRSEITDALARGSQVLAELRVPLRLNCPRTDPISMLLIQSILDAYSATRGAITLKPPPADMVAPEDLMSGRCSVERIDSGVNYMFVKGDGRPLLIISTTGSPISIWSRVLNDRDLNRGCLMVQSRSGPLFEGGTPRSSSLLQDAADIKEVLSTKNLNEVDVVAWCNGCRLAIELVRSASGRVASLLLVAPTFHGAADPSKYPSPFEDNLGEVYKILIQDPQMGRYLLDSLTEAPLADLAKLRHNPEKRVNDVLRLPPHAYTKSLLAPMSSVEYFTNYIERISTDKTYDVRTAIAELRCPILLLTGTHDAAINTQAARDLLMQHGRDVLHLTVAGGGHHIHLLQYIYFKYALDTWLSRSSPVGTARLNVERLAGQE